MDDIPAIIPSHADSWSTHAVPYGNAKPYADLQQGTKQLIDGIIFLDEMRDAQHVPLRAMGIATTVDGTLDTLPTDLQKRIAHLRERYAYDIQQTKPRYLAMVIPARVFHEIAQWQQNGTNEHVRALTEALTALPRGGNEPTPMAPRAR